MSLRARVALAATLATALAAVLAGSGLLALVERDERRALDARLDSQFDVVARPGVLAATLREGRLVRDRERFVPGVLARIEGRGGFFLESEGFPALASPPPLGYASVEDAGGTEWRAFTRQLRPPPGLGLPQDAVRLELVAPLASVEGTLTALRRRVLTVGALAVLAAGGAAWALAGVALRPLGQLRARAQRVGDTVDLSVRVPEGSGPREVDELARTLNAMLARIEEEAARTRDALEASRAFAANAAHELRTPLTSMRTNLEVLRRGSALPAAEREQVLADIAEQQARLLAVLEALRLLARGDLASTELFADVDLAALVTSAVEQARARYPEAELALEVAPGRTEVHGWSEGLRVLVDNLLRNACTHGRSADGRARVTVALAPREDRVLLRVADRGPGVPAAEREAVLARFARGTTASGAGSGLGLALVAQQAALHGGEVRINAGEAGAAVSVELPVARLDRPPAAKDAPWPPHRGA